MPFEKYIKCLLLTKNPKTHAVFIKHIFSKFISVRIKNKFRPKKCSYPLSLPQPSNPFTRKIIYILYVYLSHLVSRIATSVKLLDILLFKDFFLIKLLGLTSQYCNTVRLKSQRLLSSNNKGVKCLRCIIIMLSKESSSETQKFKLCNKVQ